ncbi:hypothetical protein TNCV_4000611 [Trichonephila clavipes]|nr:hypothetical protein TNCV_4000611 [Trichonephila clavipes]
MPIDLHDDQRVYWETAGPSGKRLLGTRKPRLGFGDWSHRSGHLHVLGPDHSRGHAICGRRAPGRNSGPRHD